MEKIARQSPHGHCIFCEDIRQEVNGKQTYVGVFNGPDLNVLGTLPTHIGKLCISVYFAQLAREIETPVRLQTYLPGDEEGNPSAEMEINMPALKAGLPPPPPELQDPFVGLTVAFEFNPLQIKAEGDITVRAVIGEKYAALGSIKVRARPLPTAPAAETKEAAN